MNINEANIAEIVKRVLFEEMQNKEGFTKVVDKSGVISIKTQEVKCEKFTETDESDDVYLTDVLTLDESPRLGCGVMEMEETSFSWDLKYDEIDYVIEGTLEIIVDGNKVTAEAGEMIFIPANTSIKFSTPNKTRYLYVTYPANWADM